MSTARFVSYAQNLEDVMLWRALGGAVDGGGFYIDVGAADPTALNVTRAFYDRGWRGLNIEPLPEQAGALREARVRDVTVECAVADVPGRRRFHRVHRHMQTGLSTLDDAEAERYRAGGGEVETIEVAVETLAGLCRAYVDGPVHFLKIDAEGAEAAVLAGADFGAVRPWIVLLEATAPLTERASEYAWETGLLAAGYAFVWFDGLNRFYLAEEHSELARHFRVPPNVFDAYVQYDAGLHEHLAAIEEAAASRAARVEVLQAEIDRLVLAREVPAAAVAASEEVAAEPAAAIVTARRGLVRRVLGVPYRVLRPLLRPLAWRFRVFMTGELIREMADLRARQAALSERVEAVHEALPPVGPAMERLLLTLALEDTEALARRGLGPVVYVPPGLSNGESGR